MREEINKYSTVGKVLQLLQCSALLYSNLSSDSGVNYSIVHSCINEGLWSWHITLAASFVFIYVTS